MITIKELIKVSDDTRIEMIYNLATQGFFKRGLKFSKYNWRVLLGAELIRCSKDLHDLKEKCLK